MDFMLGELFEGFRPGGNAVSVGGLGRLVTKVGSAIMAGGNIRGYTKGLTNGIALDTAKWNLVLCMAVGIILLTRVFEINILFHHLQSKGYELSF